MSIPARCLTPDCQRLARVRGVCQPCYERRRREVESGQATEVEQQAAGLLPAQSRRVRNDEWFMRNVRTKGN